MSTHEGVASQTPSKSPTGRWRYFIAGALIGIVVGFFVGQKGSALMAPLGFAGWGSSTEIRPYFVLGSVVSRAISLGEAPDEATALNYIKGVGGVDQQGHWAMFSADDGWLVWANWVVVKQQDGAFELRIIPRIARRSSGVASAAAAEDAAVAWSKHAQAAINQTK
jgi:hypothetical protein